MAKLKNYDILDLCKYISSLFIVAIHSALFPLVLYPWLRLAVPLYFVISSFLLFRKINHSHKNEKWPIIRKYIFRLLKFYLFWFIVCLPATIMLRSDWFAQGKLIGILIVVRETLFSSTFKVSWFIVALIWGSIILGLIANRKSNFVILFLTFVIYILICLRSSYYFMFSDNPAVNSFVNLYEKYFTNPVWSFPAGLFLMMLGKIFADDLVHIKKRIVYWIIIIISALLLYVEWRYVYYISGAYNNDFYLFLAPLVFGIFGLSLTINIKIKSSKLLRNLSNVTYPVHASIAYLLSLVLANYFASPNVLAVVIFISTLACCYLICFIILWLEKFKWFAFLKISH